MLNRREMIQVTARIVVWCGTALGAAAAWASSLAAGIRKRIVPRKATPDSLRNANPKHLDTRNLEVMPLNLLESVGDRDFSFDPATWRLEIVGAVKHPMSLTYDEVRSLSAEEREVLLICQGVFAFHGRWKGVPLVTIAGMVRLSQDAKTCIIEGHSRSGVRKERFMLEKAALENFLLAYGVNGQTLEPRNGFPLRAVAPGHWGERWVKYVMKIEFR